MAKPGRSSLALMLALTVVGLARTAAAQQIPAPPPDFNFTQDYASLYDGPTRDRIGAIQRTAFEQYKTPIVVVTINSMAQYGWAGSIEPFATAWFNAWGIGSKEANQGILLLISVADRKARIELGAAWEHRWDGHCRTIMDYTIVPRFKKGQFAEGTVEGLQALAEMAKLSPYANVPEPGAFQKMGQAWTNDEKVSPLSPLSVRLILPMVLGGLLCFVLAYFMPEQRKWLVWIGIGLIVAALALWLIIAVIAILNRGRGGGASGSW